MNQRKDKSANCLQELHRKHFFVTMKYNNLCSWAITRDDINVIVAVPPNEEVPVPICLILKNEPPPSHWKTCAGTLVYETDDFQVALLVTVARCESTFISNQPKCEYPGDWTRPHRILEASTLNWEASTSSSSTDAMTKLNFGTMLQIVRPMIVSLLRYIDLIIEHNQNESLFNLENDRGNGIKSDDLVNVTQLSNTYVTLFQKVMQGYINSYDSTLMLEIPIPSEVLSLETSMNQEIMYFLTLTVMMMKAEIQQ
ncbi:uncharacterized protein LOC130664814 isoform X2 [Microplitis mediator]|uniref:uncharacterized protein LOC130664814 isoform X2 n=1 Tax=Microplitis mediator TaxID=375433 RepID=UPI002555F8FE|nr:uncharacterized protein LOC130664814 isoform X2 [Microplitis mediator]